MLKSKDLYVLKWERQQRFRPGSQDLFLVASTGELLKVPTKVSKISDSNAVFQAIFKQRRPLVIFPQLPGQLPLHVFESRCSWACVFLFWTCNVHGEILEPEAKLQLRVGCWGLRMLGRFETYISIAVTAKLEDGRDSSDPHSLGCVSAGRRQARGAQIHLMFEMRRQPRFWDPLWKRHGLSFETKVLYKSLWLSTSRSFRCYECKCKRWSKVLR